MLWPQYHGRTSTPSPFSQPYFLLFGSQPPYMFREQRVKWMGFLNGVGYKAANNTIGFTLG